MLLSSSSPLLWLLWWTLVLLQCQQAVAEGPNCNIPLNDASSPYPCIAECLGRQQQSTESFVCDISAEWMHHVGGMGDWYPATPPKGTGVHEYVSLEGTPPCSKNGHCPGCDKDKVQGKRICSVFIDPTDCSVQCPSSQTPSKLIIGGGLVLLGAGFVYWKMNSTKKDILKR